MKNVKKISAFSNLAELPVYEEPVRDYVKLSDTDRQLLNACSKIRNAAKSRNIKIDYMQHRLSNNLHLFKFIELCGYTVDSFVINYLSYLQPINVVIDQSQSHAKDKVICVVELTYKFFLYIKVDLTQFHEIVISFHEDQNRYNYAAIAKRTSPLVIADEDGIAGQETLAPCTLTVGFMILKHRLRALCIENNIFLVQMDEIDTLLLNFVNRKLQSFMPEEELSGYFTDTKAVSFTSYGDNELNDVSLLIDYINSLC